MNLLRGTTVYLAGAVDHHANPRLWREKIAKNIFQPMGVKVYDPLVKPSWLSNPATVNPATYREILSSSHVYAAEGTYNDVIRDQDDVIWGGMMEVRNICLRMAANCDFMVVSLPKRFTVGTFEEISVAAKAGKPILFYMPDGVTVSTWLPTQVANSIEDFSHNCFEVWSDLYEYLNKINAGTTSVDNFKWLFLSYFNDEKVKAIFNDLSNS